jgi:AcrR family transcriptional regulator
LTALTSRVTAKSRVPRGRQGSGRPRDPDVERRAFEAARRIYGESGKSQVTFSNVAARASIGKPALYRRWDTPQDLLIEAMRGIPLPESIPDLGDAQAELAGYARGLMSLYVSPDGAAMMRVTTEFHDETAPFRQWIADTSQGMIALAAEVIERAVRRGEPKPPLSAEVVMEVLTGTMLSHTVTRLHAGELPPEEDIEEYCWRLAGLVLGRVESKPPT